MFAAIAMPIYEYECASCGKRFDQLQRLSDPDPTDCPTCGVSALKRAITAASFRLKGGGWYETDFKSEQDKKRNLVDGSADKAATEAKGDSASDSKTAPAADSKSESKAETKTETKTAEPAKAAPASTPSGGGTSAAN